MPASVGRKRRKLLAAGDDPSEAKKEAKRLTVLKRENPFETVAREWFAQRKHDMDKHHC